MLAREAVRGRDPVLLKLLRMLSQHQQLQHQAKFVPVVADLAHVIQVQTSPYALTCAELSVCWQSSFASGQESDS